MKTVIRYLWRTKWAGRWGTTRHYATEEEIRKSNPEAIRIDASRKEFKELSTPEEIARAIGQSDVQDYGGKLAHQLKPGELWANRLARSAAEQSTEVAPAPPPIPLPDGSDNHRPSGG